MATLSLREVRTKLSELSERRNDQNLTLEQRTDIGCEIEELCELRQTLLERDAGVNVAATPSKRVAERRESSEEWRGSSEYREQFIDWCRGGRAPETRAISTTSSSGVLVPKVYEDGVLKYIERNTVVRNLADIKTGCQGSVTLRYNTTETDAAVTSFWTTETDKTATAIDGAWAEVNLNPVGGLPKSEVTQWALRQANFDLESEIMDHLQRQIARGLEYGYTLGTGSDQPTGLFLWDSNMKSVAVSAAHGSGTGWDGAFTVANLTELRYKTLPAEYWTSAAWIMSQDAYYTIAKLPSITNSNVPAFVPSADAGVVNAAPFTLMGRPVYIAPYAPGRKTAAITNTVPLMFANVSEAFAIREWGGVSMFRDDVTAPGTVKFQGMVFANSKIIRPKAVAALKITLT